MTGEKVDFTHLKATALVSLYGKAMESRMLHPLLGDGYAAEAVARIDYPFKRLKLSREAAVSIAGRALQFDYLTEDFLRAHRTATLLHLGCGLDARVFRVGHSSMVRWFDLDLPDVAALRGRTLPKSPPGAEVLGRSVFEPSWLRDIPREHPALIIAEGVIPYLDPHLATTMLRQICQHFRFGEIAFDAYTSLGRNILSNQSFLRFTGASMQWPIDSARDVEAAVPALKLLEQRPVYDAREIGRTGSLTSLVMQLALGVPAVRGMSRILRFSFGKPAETLRDKPVADRKAYLDTLIARAKTFDIPRP